MRPDIEEFKKALLLKHPSYIPNAELGIHPKIKEKFLGRPVSDLNDDVQFWYRAGYDYIKLQPAAEFNVGTNSKTGESLTDQVSEDFKWANEGKGLICSFDDFEKFNFPQASGFDYSNFENVKYLLPEKMGVIGQYGDIFTMTWELLGFEGFSFAIYENPELVKAVNDKIGQLVLSMFIYFAECENVDVIWYSDDIAFANGLLVSPEILDQYFFPWLKKIGDLAAQYNKPFIYHSDGILYDVMDDIIGCGVNALHPIEPKAMNLVDVKNKYGNKLCLMGNIDVDLLSRGTIEEVRNQVIANMEIMKDCPGYCLGSGNSIPEYINFANYVEMLKTVNENG